MMSAPPQAVEGLSAPVAALLVPDSGVLVQQLDLLLASGITTIIGNFRDALDKTQQLRGYGAVLVEASGSQDAALLAAFAQTVGVPVIALVANLNIADTRSLMRSGIADVLPLPLAIGDLQEALRAATAGFVQPAPPVRAGTLCVFAKSAGGVGTTMAAVQMAALLASGGKPSICVLDLDVQCGSAAMQLDLQPSSTLAHLLAASERLDGEFLRSVAVHHPAGFHLIAAPDEIMPLESLAAEQVTSVVRLLTTQFDVVIVDLPGSWTNWSVEVLMMADVLFLITLLTVPCLRHARRKLELLQLNNFDSSKLAVVANRYEKGWLKPIDVSAAERVLGNSIDYCIANDPQAIDSAINEGRLLTEANGRSRAVRDLKALAARVALLVEAAAPAVKVR